MGSDVTRGEAPRPVPTADGSAILFSAPIDGSYELWRIAVSDGRLERLTEGHHYISGWDAVPGRARRVAHRLPALVADRDARRLAPRRAKAPRPAA